MIRTEYIIDDDFLDDETKMSVESQGYLWELTRCKDCKYFELDYIDKGAMSIPLIMAHEICTRWGNGCKTSSDGYCFMAERKEE